MINNSTTPNHFRGNKSIINVDIYTPKGAPIIINVVINKDLVISIPLFMKYCWYPCCNCIKRYIHSN